MIHISGPFKDVLAIHNPYNGWLGAQTWYYGNVNVPASTYDVSIKVRFHSSMDGVCQGFKIMYAIMNR